MENLIQKTLVLLCMLFCGWTSANATEKTIESPNGRLQVVVSDEGGCPVWSANRDGVEFIGKSPLGILMNFEDLTQGLNLTKCTINTINDEYSLKTIKKSHVKYEATEAVCEFSKEGRHAIDVIFRISNRDVAFRYKILPKGETLSGVVEHEASGFAMSEGTTTFLCPQSKPMVGFAHTMPRMGRGIHIPLPLQKQRQGMDAHL